MAITALNDYAIGDIDLTAIVETLDKTYKGKAEITLSEYDTDSAPDVKVGSVFENNGALFIVDTSDITPTGYSGISVSTIFYLYYDESAGAFIYSSTAPTWSDALQGWYNGNDRAFFSMYKDSGGTLYENKVFLKQLQMLAKNIMHVQDQKASGTDGGTFTSGAWRTRDLNTVLTNTIIGASLATNQITLPAGTYKINASAPAADVNYHIIQLYNITDTTAIMWSNTAVARVSNTDLSNASISGIFSLSGSKVLELQHRCQTTSSGTGGLGYRISAVVAMAYETYTNVFIEKIG